MKRREELQNERRKRSRKDSISSFKNDMITEDSTSCTTSQPADSPQSDFVVEQLLNKENIFTSQEKTLLMLPPEIFIHHIMPLLDLQSLISISQTCSLLHTFTRLTLTFSHPLLKYLYFHHFSIEKFYVLNYDCWHSNILSQEEPRRNWYRELSKRKKFVPEKFQFDLKWLLTCLLRQTLLQEPHFQKSFLSNAIRIDTENMVSLSSSAGSSSGDKKSQNTVNNSENQERNPYLTSMLYRSLSILMGMYEKKTNEEIQVPKNLGFLIHVFLPNHPEFIHSLFFYLFLESFYQLHPHHPPVLPFTPTYDNQTGNLYLKSPLLTHPQLFPSLIRSLFWIQKEKHHKKRTLFQVEQLFMYLPWFLRLCVIEEIGNGGELSLLSTFYKRSQQPVPDFHQLPLKEGGKIGDFIRICLKTISEEGKSMRQRINLQQDQNPILETLPREEQEMQFQLRQILAFAPVRIAILTSLMLLFYFPSCFQPMIVSIIIKNGARLILWGFDSKEVKWMLHKCLWKLIETCEREEFSFKQWKFEVPEKSTFNLPAEILPEIVNAPDSNEAIEQEAVAPEGQVESVDVEKSSEWILGKRKLEILKENFLETLNQQEWHLARNLFHEMVETLSVQINKMP